MGNRLLMSSERASGCAALLGAIGGDDNVAAAVAPRSVNKPYGVGGAGSANVRPLADPTIREMICQLRALLSKSQSSALTPAEIDTSAIRGTERGDSGILGNAICYAGKPNHWLIRASGQLGRCTVLLDDPRNNLGYLGQDGTLHINNHLLTPWLEGFRDLDPELLACPAIGLPALPQKRIIAIAAA